MLKRLQSSYQNHPSYLLSLTRKKSQAETAMLHLMRLLLGATRAIENIQMCRERRGFIIFLPKIIVPLKLFLKLIQKIKTLQNNTINKEKQMLIIFYY